MSHKDIVDLFLFIKFHYDLLGNVRHQKRQGSHENSQSM